MRKFLCYDTNDAASGKINVDNRGMLKPNSTVPSGSAPYQQLVTDGEGGVKWEDRLAYEHTEWKDFTSSLDSRAGITGFTMPPVGGTVTVKVNGVESVETVKSGEIDGLSYSYIGSTDMAGLASGDNGWLVMDSPGEGTFAFANPETTISLPITEQHKIDEKYIQQDKNFVRPLSYYISKDLSMFKHYYNESGEVIIAYKTDSIIPPYDDNVCIDDVSSYAGIGKFGSVNLKAFFVTLYGFLSKGTISVIDCIYGTEETYIAKIATDYGYTLTTKPTT